MMKTVDESNNAGPNHSKLMLYYSSTSSRRARTADPLR